MRNTGSETYRFIREKNNIDKEIKEQELELRREELKENMKMEELKNEQREKMELQTAKSTEPKYFPATTKTVTGDDATTTTDDGCNDGDYKKTVVNKDLSIFMLYKF